MQTLMAVIEDLFRFACESVFGTRRSANTYMLHSPYVNAMQKPLLPAARKAPAVQLLSESVQEVSSDLKSGSLQFIGQKEVPMHTDPVMSFDVISQYIPYGEQVRLMKLGGRWAYVSYKEREGWIFKDTLREQAKEVHPQFEEGHVYYAEDPETIKLRLFIHDAFCGARSSLPLTDAEYVTYKLQQKQLSLPFDAQRPRTPGTWQKLLRGRTGVHSGIFPRTGSVMEYVVDDIGYVTYVEAVFPDESIKISAVGLVQEGEFTLQTFTKDQYKELHPVFIEVV